MGLDGLDSLECLKGIDFQKAMIAHNTIFSVDLNHHKTQSTKSYSIHTFVPELISST